MKKINREISKGVEKLGGTKQTLEWIDRGRRLILFLSIIGLVLFVCAMQGYAQKRGAPKSRADILLKNAVRFYLSSHNDAARRAYNEAKVLYQQVQDRLGEANAVRALEKLEKAKTSKTDEIIQWVFENKVSSGLILAVFAAILFIVRQMFWEKLKEWMRRKKFRPLIVDDEGRLRYFTWRGRDPVHLIDVDGEDQQLHKFFITLCAELRNDTGKEPQFDNPKRLTGEIVYEISSDFKAKWRLLGGMGGGPGNQVLVLTDRPRKSG